MTLAYVCDACGKRLSMRDMRVEDLPISIKFEHDLLDPLPRHFCDWECVELYAHLQAFPKGHAA